MHMAPCTMLEHMCLFSWLFMFVPYFRYWIVHASSYLCIPPKYLAHNKIPVVLFTVWINTSISKLNSPQSWIKTGILNFCSFKIVEGNYATTLRRRSSQGTGDGPGPPGMSRGFALGNISCIYGFYDCMRIVLRITSLPWGKQTVFWSWENRVYVSHELCKLAVINFVHAQAPSV